VAEAILPAEKSVELQCGRCGQVVYVASKWKYDRQLLREAVDAHKRVCPKDQHAEKHKIRIFSGCQVCSS